MLAGFTNELFQSLAAEKSSDSFEDELVGFKGDEPRKLILKASKVCRVSLRITFCSWLSEPLKAYDTEGLQFLKCFIKIPTFRKRL